MIDKTPPYVIDFDDIREGDTIERTTPDGSKTILIAAHYEPRWWWSPDRDLAINDGGGTITLLERPEPPKPGLPTTPGTVIAGMHRNRPFVAVGWSDKGDFRGVYLDGTGTLSDLAELGPSQTFDWTVIHDPSTPKTDWQRWVDEAKRFDCGVEIDGIYIQTSERYRATEVAAHAGGGLRERLEKLADDFESLPDATITTRYIAHHLREALDGSAVTVAPVDPTAPEPDPVTVRVITEDSFLADTCGESCPRSGYYCTRSKGHDGLHVAATSSRGVCAYWGEVQP